MPAVLIWITERVARAAGAALLAAVGYLLVLLGAAAAGRRRAAPPPGASRTRFAVLVPAHDEETVIADAVDALLAQDYPRAAFEVVVVADNCRDGTAAAARRAGALVIERTDPDARGKGPALAWAIANLPAEVADADALAFVDADCAAAPNFLAALDARLAAGASAAQSAYVVANPGAGSTAALRYAAFALINWVRPLGKTTLGLSGGLLGTGMAFRRELLAEVPWESFGLAEDQEYHLSLVAAGKRVDFAPETSVSSPMPTSHEQAHEQQLRWEGGKWQLVQRWTLPLVLDGLERRDPVRVHHGLEPLVPTQSMLFGASLLLVAVGALLRLPAVAARGSAALAGQAVYVIGGLFLIRAPAPVWRALAAAPALAIRKLGIQLRLASGDGREWKRTEREPS